MLTEVETHRGTLYFGSGGGINGSLVLWKNRWAVYPNGWDLLHGEQHRVMAMGRPPWGHGKMFVSEEGRIWLERPDQTWEERRGDP